MPIFPSFRQTLTLSEDGLVVDGVLLIGEYGDYPHCESPILQVWGENAIPIPLGRYSDRLKRDR